VYAYAALYALYASGLRLGAHCDKFAQMAGGRRAESKTVVPRQEQHPQPPTGGVPPALMERTTAEPWVPRRKLVLMALTTLTVAQLTSNLNALYMAWGNPTLRARFPDGREVQYRTVDDFGKAIAETRRHPGGQRAEDQQIDARGNTGVGWSVRGGLPSVGAV